VSVASEHPRASDHPRADHPRADHPQADHPRAEQPRASSPDDDGTRRRITAVKFIVAGGFGVGKTTFVGSISEVEPLRTEAPMTVLSSGVDDTSAVSGKTTTTVVLDFGRITVDDTLIMYLFGTPGQDRFGFIWDDLIAGALGAVVLVDTRRVGDCFAACDYFERRSIPFVVGVNGFDSGQPFPLDEVREALDLAPHVPVVNCDARSRESVKEVLITLLTSLTARLSAGARA